MNRSEVLDLTCGVWAGTKHPAANRRLDTLEPVPGEVTTVVPSDQKSVDWSAASIEELVVHITREHHHRSRVWLDDAFCVLTQGNLAAANAHLEEMIWKFRIFSSDMRMHFDQEEGGLFPACIALDQEMQTKAHIVNDASILRDIHIMSAGHISARETLAELMALSRAIGLISRDSGLSLPHILGQLDLDLIEHERLEDEILLPAVLFQLDLSKSMHTSGPFNYTEDEPSPPGNS